MPDEYLHTYMLRAMRPSTVEAARQMLIDIRLQGINTFRDALTRREVKKMLLDKDNQALRL